MSGKKKLKWVAIFLTLVMATMWIGTGIAAPNSHAANAVKAAGLGGADNVAVVEAGDENSGWLAKFSRKFEDQTVCAVSRGQYDRLVAEYGASVESASIDGAAVDIVKISSGDAKAKDLLDIIQGDHTGPGKCKVVKKASFFYMMFNANIS